MKNKVVGVFEFGFQAVELVARDGTGGAFYCMAKKSRIAQIEIGMQYTAWRQVLNVLLHETFELAFHSRSVRFTPWDDISNSHDQFLFVFNHPYFSSICADVAEFITPAVPALASVWKKWPKKPLKEAA